MQGPGHALELDKIFKTRRQEACECLLPLVAFNKATPFYDQLVDRGKLVFFLGDLYICFNPGFV